MKCEWQKLKDRGLDITLETTLTATWCAMKCRIQFKTGDFQIQFAENRFDGVDFVFQKLLFQIPRG